jgi:hypothetical protein
MPRKRRTQPGSSGGAYSNRTDLAQPARIPTGMPYGQAQELEQAQQQMPLPQAGPMDGFNQALGAAAAHDFAPVPLNAPTARPSEPVTAGLPVGPGPGPEVLGQRRGLSDLLARLHAETQNDVILDMLDSARRQGL